MKSGLRRLANQRNGPPVPLGGGAFTKGRMFNLGAGKNDRENFMRQYGVSGTLYSIISLLAETTASSKWRLYKKSPQDGRRRYNDADKGSDNRIEVIKHPAIQLWNSPNTFHSGFEFREGAQQHQELTGETFWVMDMDIGFPTSLWFVRPDRMEPVPDTDGFLTGWIYTGPNGEQVPLKNSEVILEKRPDPLDPYRGAGPVASILPNIQQQRYATEYQRNLFLNGADPGGVITVPSQLNDRDFDQLIDRWRESHRGISRAGHVGVLEAGAQWTPRASTNKDLEYGNLRLANRDELREAWRVHKTMLGTSDDVNRANAQTAQEVFVTWQNIPRLNRRADTLNFKFLDTFGNGNSDIYEFDYDDPSPVNAENAGNELFQKAQAAQLLIESGLDSDDVLETCGLPPMKMSEVKEIAKTPPVTPATPSQQQQTADQPPAFSEAQNRASYTLLNAKNAGTKAIQQELEDFPASAVAWMYRSSWVGPVDVPVDHVDFDSKMMEGIDPQKVQKMVKKLQGGKNLKPVILVMVPGQNRLQLADGHHRFLADEEDGKTVRAFVGTVPEGENGWQTMHEQQYTAKDRPKPVKASSDALPLASLLLTNLVGLNGRTRLNGHEKLEGANT